MGWEIVRGVQILAYRYRWQRGFKEPGLTLAGAFRVTKEQKFGQTEQNLSNKNYANSASSAIAFKVFFRY